MIEAGAAVLAALVLALGGLRFGVPAYKHWQHGRCLVRIAALEIEMGIRPDPLAALHEMKAANYALALATAKPATRDRRADGLEEFRRQEVELARLYEKRRKLGVKWW